MTNSDIIAVAACIIALCAFGVSIFQTYTTFRHNKLQVRPIISIESSTQLSEKFIALHNLGLGPAIIISINASYGEKNYDLLSQDGIDSFTDLITETTKSNVDFITTCLQKNAAIPAGGCEKLIVIQKTGGIMNKEEIEEFIHKTRMNVKYKCIYGEMHLANNAFS